MIPNNPKELYSRFLKGHEGKLHFAAHSHHFWPDCSREAQIQYWDDCAKVSDDKWNMVFSEVIPQAQKHISHMLNLSHPEQITFAPNTHELSARILSLFLGKPSLNILTTSSEFHSWKRQVLRLKELPQISVSEISCIDFLNQRSSILEKIKSELKKSPDLFFMSQVFFDSGLCFTDEELTEIVSAAPASTVIVIDGYHAFGSIPTNLKNLEGRIFYLGGGYKYAQAGEGVGFLVVPKGNWRPAYTGWFAEYTDLSKPKGAEVGFSPDGMAFMGATQDPSGLYRFNAVWHVLGKNTVSEIHQYVKDLQLEFIKLLPESFKNNWQLSPLFDPALKWHGHFLTFEASDETLAQKCVEHLRGLKIYIDRRGKRLRFGFGTYQDLKDVRQLCSLL